MRRPIRRVYSKGVPTLLRGWRRPIYRVAAWRPDDICDCAFHLLTCPTLPISFRIFICYSNHPNDVEYEVKVLVLWESQWSRARLFQEGLRGQKLRQETEKHAHASRYGRWYRERLWSVHQFDGRRTRLTGQQCLCYNVLPELVLLSDFQLLLLIIPPGNNRKYMISSF